MIARQLKVYKDTYELVKLLITSQIQFDKCFKYTLGEKMQTEAISLFECIQKANMYRDERTAHLESFIVHFETLKTYLRLAYDFHQIPTKRQAAIYQLVELIGRQISAWKNSCQTKARHETTGDIDKGLRESTNGKTVR